MAGDLDGKCRWRQARMVVLRPRSIHHLQKVCDWVEQNQAIRGLIKYIEASLRLYFKIIQDAANLILKNTKSIFLSVS